MLKTLLKRFDKNSDGCISAEELGPELKRYACLDVDGDGVISVKDFRIIGACACQGMRPGSLQRQAMREEREKGPRMGGRDGERLGRQALGAPQARRPILRRYDGPEGRRRRVDRQRHERPSR